MKKTKESIKKAYESACNDYLLKLLENWGLSEDGNLNIGWWVGDEVGGVFCCEDDTFIDMIDIVYCVDNDVDYDTYTDYIDYITKCEEYGFDKLNLNAFVKGAPRVSGEEFNQLDKMKQEIYDSIEEIKKNL